MNRQFLALYECLLHDLSRHLPSSVIRDLRNGDKVDRWPDITPKQCASLQLALSFFKKYEGQKSDTADDAALRKFMAVNNRAETWVYNTSFTWEDEAIGTVKKHIDNLYYSNNSPMFHDISELFALGRCGPGSSIGDSLGTDYSKMYDGPLTTTSPVLYRAYVASFQGNPTLIDAEQIRQANHGNPKLVAGNRLTFVPKQKEISRTICTEPVLNMYAQLGAGRLLEDGLRRYFGIDLATQPDRNRELARLGSLNGSYCTIDLESASDSMSLTMLRCILPKDMMSYLEILRSPVCDLPDNSRTTLHMISTMGNGFTFPLQTIIFAAVVSAAYDMLGIKTERGVGNSHKNWGTFGDDIIVVKRAYSTVTRILSLLGFTVNAEKSFSEGPFRESCGGDYFNGHPVRGVYVKTLDTQQARCIVINRLHDWSAETGVLITSVTKFLWALTQKRFVPPWENQDAGLKVPNSLIETCKRARSIQATKYLAYEARTRNINLEREITFTRRGMLYNPSGLLLSFLRGHIRNGRVSLRQREIAYVTKAKIAPSWDYPRKVHIPDMCWQRWETAVWLTVS